MCWIKLDRVELGSQSGMKWAKLGRIGVSWPRLSLVEQGLFELSRVELGWHRQHWAKVDRVGHELG